MQVRLSFGVCGGRRTGTGLVFLLLRGVGSAPVISSDLGLENGPLLAVPSVAVVEDAVSVVHKRVKLLLNAQQRYKDLLRIEGRNGGEGTQAQVEAMAAVLSLPRPVLRQRLVDTADNSRVDPVKVQRLHRLLFDYKVEPLLGLDALALGSALAKEELFDERAMRTKIVPYQFFCEQVLQSVQCPLTKRWIDEDIEAESLHYTKKETLKGLLRQQHANVSMAVPGSAYDFPTLPFSPFLGWEERDVYVQQSRLKQGRWRIPMATIMGHIDHGKTTLLDTLQHSAITATEVGHITQSIRAFTISVPHAVGNEATYSNARHITFVDTPGHKVFAEIRLAGQAATDLALVLIALDEGVQGQTEEVLRAALYSNKPMLLLLNKVDLFRDPTKLATAIGRIIASLLKLGIDMTLLDNEKTLAKLKAKPKKFAKHCVPGEERNASASFGVSQPLTKSTQRRQCLAVCLSGKQGTNVPFLLRVLQEMVEVIQPKADASNDHVQAVLLETYRSNRSDQTQLVMNTLIRSGQAKKGMPFVADQTYGCIQSLSNQWGHPLPGGPNATGHPGMAVNIRGSLTRSAPMAGTHLISVPSMEAAKRCHEYRVLLRKFVAQYWKRLDTLRPKGLPCHFHHIGNFGQIKDDQSLAFKILHREAQPAEAGADTVWQSMQYDTPAQSEREHEVRVRQSDTVCVLCKTDNGHNARIMAREIPRLGTRNIRFEVVGVTMGEFNMEEMQKFNMCKLIASFRGRPLRDYQVARRLELMSEAKYGHFELFTDVVQFVKDFAVEKQRDFERRVREEGYDVGKQYERMPWVSPGPPEESPEQSTTNTNTGTGTGTDAGHADTTSLEAELDQRLCDGGRHKLKHKGEDESTDPLLQWCGVGGSKRKVMEVRRWWAAEE